MIKDLVYIGTELDRRGLIEEASFVDSLLFKYSEDIIGDTLDGVSGRIENVDEALAPVKDVVGRAEGAINNTEKIVSTALGFADKLISGDANFSSKISGTSIPGIAFIGQLLRLPQEALKIVDKVKSVWSEIYRIIKQKIDTGTFGRACITAADLGAYKDHILFFLGLLYGPMAGIIKRALNIAKTLDDLGLTSFSDITLCIGEDLKSEAQSVMTNMETAAVEWGDEINEYIAYNMHREVGDTAFA
jgi:hypothetical protein